MRPAFTLVEMALVLTLVAIVAGITVPAVARQLDRMAVASATAELAGAFQAARDQAIATGRPMAVRLDETSPAVTVEHGADTLVHRDLAAAHGVSLTATRDSMTYLPNALAAGAANLSVTVTRGAATRTLTVSRLGRVRW
ncbi:MAG TPA: GspH/FimT family pseudopilin [Gemmatimonadaceae bacterium]|nr:GspH/FimT family pseudopilin [Gemmatimonadaceae bacterium]